MKIKKTNENNTNKFLEDFRNREGVFASIFSYPVSVKDNYQDRILYLSREREQANRNKGYEKYIDRKLLASILKKDLKKYAALSHKELPIQMKKNIDLISKGALTLVTGQQAGLGTGPLYTINKTISLIKHAKDLEKKYGQAVVPVFWVASEDHDIDEIDHLYINNKSGLKRLSIPWGHIPNRSASKVILSDYNLKKLEFILTDNLEDSPYKAETIKKIISYYAYNSLSDAFALFLYEIFAEYGLIIFDSDNPEIRREEKYIFENIIKEESLIRRKIDEGILKIEELGHKALVKNDDQKIGVFVNWDDQRRAVRSDGQIFNLAGHELSTEDLLLLLEERPEDFSTNVLTRPIMQEYLFQPISYIGGQAELQYWGQTKEIFEFFTYQMPLVELRNSYTYISKDLQKKIRHYKLDYHEIIVANQEYISEVCQEEFGDLVFSRDNSFLDKEFKKIIQKYYSDLGNNKLSDKSLLKVQENLLRNLLDSFAKSDKYIQAENRKINRTNRQDITWIMNELLPRDGRQERTVNVFQYINLFGSLFIEDMIKEIIKESHTMDGCHYIIEL